MATIGYQASCVQLTKSIQEHNERIFRATLLIEQLSLAAQDPKIQKVMVVAKNGLINLKKCPHYQDGLVRLAAVKEKELQAQSPVKCQDVPASSIVVGIENLRETPLARLWISLKEKKRLEVFHPEMDEELASLDAWLTVEVVKEQTYLKRLEAFEARRNTKREPLARSLSCPNDNVQEAEEADGRVSTKFSSLHRAGPRPGSVPCDQDPRGA